EWHRSILAQREQEWTERQTVSQDWKEAGEEFKQAIRRSIPAKDSTKKAKPGHGQWRKIPID
ncbi:MAG TPA: hypothetical protein VLD18_02610, partial [Verrucomicrobiae bacterium]|nr:hypothetical protein [Verrucomicrobiae bacterium]